jgi:hypothetical protein
MASACLFHSFLDSWMQTPMTSTAMLAPDLFCLTDATSKASGAMAVGRDWARSGGAFRTSMITGVAIVTTPATTKRSCFQELGSFPSWPLMIPRFVLRERPREFLDVEIEPPFSIRRGVLDAVDDEHIHRASGRFQFEPELFLHRCED